MTSNKNPWRHGDIVEAIIKFENMGARDVVRTLQTLREIAESLDLIEAEDARRAAVKVASLTFRKQGNSAD